MDQWRPTWEIAFGVGALFASLMTHGVGMLYVHRRNRDFRAFPLLRRRAEQRDRSRGRQGADGPR